MARLGMYKPVSGGIGHDHLRQLAGSCGNGPCPTFHINPTTRDVLVQGYRIDSPIPLPAGEDVVHIPADAWTRLLRDMPVRMLLAALAGRWRRSRSGRVVDDPAVSAPA